jgi:hypothetical protein
MANDREVTFSDLERAAQQRDPQLSSLVNRFLEIDDPDPGQPEEPTELEDEAPGTEVAEKPLPKDAWTLPRLSRVVGSMYGKNATERKATRLQAWGSLMSTPNIPPRLRLGQFLLDLYLAGDEPARRALQEIFRDGRVGWGMWQAFKRIYKLAEERHDAEMFGVLAWRLDALYNGTPRTGEIGRGTFIYLRRRAWRFLKRLGQAVPELFPQFATQVLRHYPESSYFSSSWVASQIWNHGAMRYSAQGDGCDPPKDLKKRAFDDTWKISAEPLLRLLEDAQNDSVCDFAIRCLRQDFPETLRKVSPAWLAHLGRKSSSTVHEFIIKLLGESPEFHQSKLRGLGLHEMVLGLLRSESAAARKYAVEYARTHGQDMAVDDLVELAISSDNKEVREFASSRLEQHPPRELGLRTLVKLLGASATSHLAAGKIQQGFKPADIDAEIFVELYVGEDDQRKFVEKFFESAKQQIPAPYYCRALDDPRCDWQARRKALEVLNKRTGAEIGAEWLKKALLEPQLQSNVSDWLRKGKLAGDDLDVEWVKGLVLRPALRSLALEILENRKLVVPSRIGLSWLLAMARQPDELLSQFAHRYLLEHFTPEDVAQEMGSTDVAVGINKLWSLLSGPAEPEPVRLFAATYLKVHHPVLGPTLAEARSLGIKPRLKRDAYGLDRLRPLHADARADVRRFAAAITEQELARWGDRKLLFQLADSPHRETRGVAAEALLKIGEADADPQRVPPTDWLTAPEVFALAESVTKATREVALTLIRRHYDQIGGAARLAWLMESPDREVRLFAVRLLWDRHRPRATPPSWKPPKGEKRAAADAGRFDSAAALQQFLRIVLFGLPPGRMERREIGGGEALPDRPLPASVAKRRLVDVVRDLSIEDGEFAKLATPVLEEFLHSEAKGEWHGCVAALARIRKAHPELQLALPAGSVVERCRETAQE